MKRISHSSVFVIIVSRQMTVVRKTFVNVCVKTIIIADDLLSTGPDMKS